MHKQKHAATHEFSEYTERENDEKGPCKHKAKQLSEYMERERKPRSGHACMQNMSGVRNIWREKKKKSIWMHTYMQKYHMG